MAPGWLPIPTRAASPRRCWKSPPSFGPWMAPAATRPARHFPTATRRRGGGNGAWLVGDSHPCCVAAPVLEVPSLCWTPDGSSGDAANSPFSNGDAAARRGSWGLAGCAFPIALRRRVGVGGCVPQMGRGWLLIPNPAAPPRRRWKSPPAAGSWMAPAQPLLGLLVALTSMMSCGAASRRPAGLTRMNRARARCWARLGAPR